MFDELFLKLVGVFLIIAGCIFLIKRKSYAILHSKAQKEFGYNVPVKLCEWLFIIGGVSGIVFGILILFNVL